MKGVTGAIASLLAALTCVNGAVPRNNHIVQDLPETVISVRVAVGHQPWLGTRNPIDDAIEKAFEALRELMPSGIPDLGIPVLDPLNVPHYDLNINSELATVQGALDNVLIRNLSTFKVEEIANDLEHLKADFALSFEQLSLSGEYDMSGQAGGAIAIFGNGNFTLGVSGFLTGGTVLLSNESGSDASPAKIERLDIHFSVKEMKANFENLMGGGAVGDLINELISESAPEFIEENQEELAGLIASKVQLLVNPVLGQYTLREILDYLGVPQ